MTMQELSDEMRKQKARCDRYCGTWNSEDRDCEIYGEQHPSPAKCRYFLECELESQNKELRKWLKEKFESCASENLSFVAKYDTVCQELDSSKAKIAELEAQIEKMKCCGNCANLCGCGLRGYEECKNFDKWEIKEK